MKSNDEGNNLMPEQTYETRVLNYDSVKKVTKEMVLGYVDELKICLKANEIPF